MHLNRIFIVFLFCTSTSLLAQNFVYPLAVGDKWQLVQIMPPFGYSYMQFEVNGDSILPNGKLYAHFTDSPTFRRQQGNQVLMYSPTDNQEHVLYDFSRSLGDTVGTYPLSRYNFKVILHDTGSYLVFGQKRRAFTFYQFTRDATDFDTFLTIVDGIGLCYFSGFIGPYSPGGAVIAGKTFGIIVSVHLHDSPPPESFNLRQNYPNPFNSRTRISFDLTRESPTRLEVFDILGRSVAVLIDQAMGPGSFTCTFEPLMLPSGVYIYRLSSAGSSQNRTLILQK